MSYSQAANSAVSEQAEVAPSAHAYDAGGPIGSLHRALSDQFMRGSLPLPAPRAQSLADRAVTSFSRALGPLLLVAGYFAIARLLF